MWEHDNLSNRKVNVPGLIAWISLCLLAAAWGRTLDVQWQHLWAELGAFGLAAALGLETIQQIRNRCASALRDSAARSRAEQSLSRLNEASAALDSVNSGVRRLTQHVAKQKRRAPEVSQAERRHWETELLSQYPLEITSVDNYPSDSPCRLGKAIDGATRQISSTAISFDHSEPLESQIVLATFKLRKHERLSFVVDVIWTEKIDSGFVSGGSLLAVGVPPAEQPDHDPAPAAVDG
jgi:hypothetical protein